MGGHDYEFGFGGDLDLSQTVSCMRHLVRNGFAARVRAMTREGIVEVARDGERTLSESEAKPILAACRGLAGRIDYEHALLLTEDGLSDLEVPGYDGAALTIHVEGDLDFVVGSVSALQLEVREAIDDAREMIADDPECRERYTEAIDGLRALGEALDACAKFDLILRTWE